MVFRLRKFAKLPKTVLVQHFRGAILNRMIYLCFLTVLVGLVSSQSNAQPTNSAVSIQLTANGLASLQYESRELLERGSLVVNEVKFSRSSGRKVPGSTTGQVSFNPQKRSEQMLFDWGRISVAYLLKASNLTISIRITNRSRFTLRSLSIDVLALKLPAAPDEYNGTTPLLATNIEAPSILPLHFGAASVILCNDEVGKPLLLGFPWSLNKPANSVFPVRINTGRESMYPDSLPFIDRPILPGHSDRFALSLRFGPAQPDILAETADLIAAFRSANPPMLKWTDRRPIGSLILGTAAAGWPTNPNGWFLDRSLDTQTEAGIAQFRRRLLLWADKSVSILKDMNAQGMITWDIEGERFPHATTYIGDPRLIEKLTPEMTSVVDDYFNRFTRAGLRVGLTIRPQLLNISSDGNTANQVDPKDPGEVLIEKIAYAKKRWGATLFYIDSNGDPSRPLSASVIRRVAARFPDVLLIPEQKNVAYYAVSSPYSELRSGYSSTSALTRAIYKDAFSIINTADGSIAKKSNSLKAAVLHGDILMFRGWYDDPANQLVREILVHP